MTEWMLLLVAFASAGEPASPPTALPVSLDRIRAGLARSPIIDLSVAAVPPPHFRVEIQGRRYFRDIPTVWDVRPTLMPSLPSPAGSPGSPALVQVDLLGLGRQIASAVGKAGRARAARAAREEVQDALREFCEDRSCDPR